MWMWVDAADAVFSRTAAKSTFIIPNRMLICFLMCFRRYKVCEFVVLYCVEHSLADYMLVLHLSVSHVSVFPFIVN